MVSALPGALPTGAPMKASTTPVTVAAAFAQLPLAMPTLITMEVASAS